jgi:predicted transcriptional regulator
VDPAFRAGLRGNGDRDLTRARIRTELQRILGVLDGTPRTIEGLADELAVPPQALIGGLSELEIVGLVEQDGAGYRRVP